MKWQQAYGPSEILLRGKLHHKSAHIFSSFKRFDCQKDSKGHTKKWGGGPNIFKGGIVKDCFRQITCDEEQVWFSLSACLPKTPSQGWDCTSGCVFTMKVEAILLTTLQWGTDWSQVLGSVFSVIDRHLVEAGKRKETDSPNISLSGLWF